MNCIWGTNQSNNTKLQKIIKIPHKTPRNYFFIAETLRNCDNNKYNKSILLFIGGFHNKINGNNEITNNQNKNTEKNLNHHKKVIIILSKECLKISQITQTKYL